jgi:hypothetical protein
MHAKPRHGIAANRPSDSACGKHHQKDSLPEVNVLAEAPIEQKDTSQYDKCGKSYGTGGCGPTKARAPAAQLGEAIMEWF